MSRALRIFISYRREDSERSAGRLYDDLVNRFGADQVSMDVDSIQPGVDFAKAIEANIASADVLIAVIGRDWLSAKALGSRSRRLDNHDDFVRVEIRSALKRGVRVIPALVQGADLPPSGQLPEDIARLARQDGIQLRHESWPLGLGQLIETIESLKRTQHGP